MAKIVYTKTTAKRRRGGRTASAYLFQLSENGHRLGTAARRILASVRLSLSGHIFQTLREVAAAAGKSLSKTARQALAISAEIERGNRAEALRMMKRYGYNDRLKPDRKSQRAETKADQWAKGEDAKARHTLINLRLNAENLADVAAQQEERRLEGLAGSYSRAFCALALIPLMWMSAALANAKRKAEPLIMAAEPIKPKRQKRDRTLTEIKRRLYEEAYKSSL